MCVSKKCVSFSRVAYDKGNSDASVGKGERVATADECMKNKKPEPGKYCPFNYKDQIQSQNEKCNKNNKYGYELGTPCVLIKLNRVSLRKNTVTTYLGLYIELKRVDDILFMPSEIKLFV